MGELKATSDSSKYKHLTTFIIPSIGRDTLQRAIDSAKDQAPVLVHIDEAREGEAAVRNELIKKAQSKWVSFLDDDDTVTDDYVKRLAEEEAKNPRADVIVFREYFIGELMDDEGSKYPDHFIWQAPVVHMGQIGISFSVKRKVAETNPFIEEPHEDFHFVRRLKEKGYNIHFSPYIVYRARH